MILYSGINEYKTIVPGLSRVKKFLSECGNPHNNIKFIHIAGTNGKGSTAKMLSEALSFSGYKTGLFTSPHLVSINERIQIDNTQISGKDLNGLSREYSVLAKKCKLTFFEYLTVLAFIYFYRHNVDIAVLETGLGGKFDSTNVVIPEVSVITSIGIDHSEILGGTISKIASEKAGIIKKQIPVVCGMMPKNALNEVLKAAKLKKSKVYLFDKDFAAEIMSFDWKNARQKVRYNGIFSKLAFNLNLLGRHQAHNVSLVLAVCEILNKGGFNIVLNNIKTIFSGIRWPARFDIRKVKLGNKRLNLIIDGAHNIDGINVFFSLWRNSPFIKKKTKFVFTVMSEKKYDAMIKKIAGFASDICLVNIDNERAVDCIKLKNKFLTYINEKQIRIYDSVKNLFLSFKNNENIVFIGSLYLAGNIIKFTEDNQNV